jgi:hypothetical protein
MDCLDSVRYSPFESLIDKLDYFFLSMFAAELLINMIGALSPSRRILLLRRWRVFNWRRMYYQGPRAS